MYRLDGFLEDDACDDCGDDAGDDDVCGSGLAPVSTRGADGAALLASLSDDSTTASTWGDKSSSSSLTTGLTDPAAPTVPLAEAAMVEECALVGFVRLQVMFGAEVGAGHKEKWHETNAGTMLFRLH